MGYSRGTVVLVVVVVVVVEVVVVAATNFYTKVYLHYRSSLDMSNKKWHHVYI